jgi:hypothetical protein
VCLEHTFPTPVPAHQSESRETTQPQQPRDDTRRRLNLTDPAVVCAVDESAARHGIPAQSEPLPFLSPPAHPYPSHPGFPSSHPFFFPSFLLLSTQYVPSVCMCVSMYVCTHPDRCNARSILAWYRGVRLARELRHKVVCGVCICVCVCVCDGKGAGLMGRVTGHVAD